LRSLKIILSIVLIYVFSSCEPIQHSFSAEELKLIDSLYKDTRDSAEVEMKIKCDSIYFAKFDSTVDSLTKIREKEILDIISK